jgi:hypothetical protein
MKPRSRLCEFWDLASHERHAEFAAGPPGSAENPHMQTLAQWLAIAAAALLGVRLLKR